MELTTKQAALIDQMTRDFMAEINEVSEAKVEEIRLVVVCPKCHRSWVKRVNSVYRVLTNFSVCNFCDENSN